MNEEENDSLELLLDTLCNAFGGIILITLLIALMSKEANVSEGEPMDYRTDWMMERQSITNLSDEIEVERSILESLLAEVRQLENALPDDLSLAANELENKRDLILEEINRIRTRLSSLPTSSAALANDLQKKVNQLREELNDKLDEQKSLEESLSRKQAKLLEISQKSEERKRDRTQVLRLPTEKSRSGKLYLWVVVRHGKIYPCYHPQKEEIFNLSQKVEVSGNPVLYHDPKPNRGFDPVTDRKELIDYFKTVNPREEYFSFMVYPDDSSFVSFNEAKELCTSMSLGYTWEPFEEILGLTKDGSGARSEL